MARPHIGYVLKRFPRLSETFVLHELLELERLGHRVTVFALGRPDEATTHPALDRLRAEVVYVPKAPAGAPRDSATRRGIQAEWVAAEVRRRSIAHLHAHFATSATALALDAHRAAGTPFSFTAHAKDIYHESVDFAFVREAILASAFTVTVSDHNVRHLLEACGRDTAAKLVRLYNGIDLRQFRFTGQDGRQRNSILAVGRFVEKKGFLDLIDALAVLRDDGHVAQVTLVGAGEQEADIRARIASHGLEGTVTMTGALTQDRVIALMQTHTVMALPCVVGHDGNRDGLPTVLLEAMASGLPVVSTDVTGIPEMIRDGVTGRVVGQHAPRALAGALDTLLASDATRARFAVAARADVEHRFNLQSNVGVLAGYFAAGHASHVRVVVPTMRRQAPWAGARA